MHKLNIQYMLLSVFFFAFLLVNISPPVYSAEVTLTWNKPDDCRVRGYFLYFGESGTNFQSEPDQIIPTENQTSCIIYNLTEGQMYNFAMTSFDWHGNESGFSETISYRVPPIIFFDDVDNDGDGFAENEGDCDDANIFRNPNAVENCLDGIDNDCDNETDCNDSDCFNDPACRICTDADGDGYYVEDCCGDFVDGDDNDINIHPEANGIFDSENDSGNVFDDMSEPIVFYEIYYLARFPDVARAVHKGEFGTGWSHYQQYGKKEGRSHAPPEGYGDFSEEYYLTQNSDIARLVKQGVWGTGWEHFIKKGIYEGRTYAEPEGYDGFDETYYLARNSDVAQAVEAGALGSGWEHYKNFGQYEGRSYAEPEGYLDFNEWVQHKKVAKFS